MKHEEEDLQVACVRWFDYQYQKIKPLLHASPNGGYRRAIEAKRFKAMGTRPGFPDLFLSIPNRLYHGLYLELKVGKNKQTDHQKEYQRLVEEQGYRYAVIRSFPEFMEQIESYINGPQ